MAECDCIGSNESSPSDEVMWMNASAMLIWSWYETLVSCISIMIELTRMDSLQSLNRFVGNPCVLYGLK